MSAAAKAIIPVSTQTWEWLKQGRPSGLAFRQRAIYGWHAFWFGVNQRLQQRLLADLKPDSLDGSVFVLGLWRSGTTLAHEILSRCSGFAAPTTRQCMNASTFALSAPPGRAAAVKRPMDAMEISPDSPQEDEFALLSLGVPTAYRAFLDPSRIREQEQLLSPAYWQEEAPAWMESWLTFLRLVKKQGEARLAIKSPGHTFRIKAIEPLFPHGRYLWITRSPDEMLYSNRKMWQAMFDRYGLSTSLAEELDHFLLQAFTQAAGCLDWLCGCVGRDRLAVIDFSHLTADPENAIAAAGTRLGLGSDAELRAACKSALAGSAGYRRDRYVAQSLPADTERVLQLLGESQKRALASHGVAA